MAIKRILITGGSGLLALNWAAHKRREYEIFLGLHKHQVNLASVVPIHVELDTPEDALKSVRHTKPDMVVHAAGLTSVDACELDSQAAFHANAEIARNVAHATHHLNIKLVHISTDHLFSGQNSFCKEKVAPQPLNVYARSKLAAERWVMEADSRALVVRTNFFGWGHAARHSISDWIIASLRRGETVPMFEDVFFTPLLADVLADTVHAIVNRSATGVFNITGDERISKYDFALSLAQEFSLPQRLIRRSRIAESHLVAPRPKDMSLDNTKVRKLLNHGLGTVKEFAVMLHHQEKDGRSQELFNAIKEEKCLS